MTPKKKKRREVSAGDVVGYRYLIRNDAGQVLATSTEVVHYVHGRSSSLPPAVSDRMRGRLSGETFSTPVSEKQAFGSTGTMRRVILPRERFPKISELPAGERIALVLPGGDAVSVWVDEAEAERVTLEIDQPFAKNGLLFEISIVSIRIATLDELQSGQPIASTSSDAAEELSTLRDVLVGRFDDEGSPGGLIDTLRQSGTKNERHVDALHDAHAMLLGKLDMIAARVRVEGTSFDHRRALAALVSALALHDEDGTNLLIDSLNQDTGGEG